MFHERSLRQITLLATAIAFPLNIAITIVSLYNEKHDYYHRRQVTAFCFGFIPLTFTLGLASASLHHTKKQGKGPTGLHFKLYELVSVLAYLGVLLPIWALEIRKLQKSGFGLLVGYTTGPMIVNLFIHIYFTLNTVPCKQIFSKIFGRTSSCQQCPNCQQTFVTGTTQTTTKKGYNLLRGEDYLDVEADPVAYRDSEDFLREGAEQAKQAKQPEDSDKNKAMVEI